jgi:hypothetical protein
MNYASVVDLEAVARLVDLQKTREAQFLSQVWGYCSGVILYKQGIAGLNLDLPQVSLQSFISSYGLVDVAQQLAISSKCCKRRSQCRGLRTRDRRQSTAEATIETRLTRLPRIPRGGSLTGSRATGAES